MEGGDPFGVAIGRRWEHDGSSEEPIGLPAAASVIQFIETTNVERGACQQDHGESKLADDQCVAAQPQGVSSASRLLGQLFTSLVSTSVR